MGLRLTHDFETRSAADLPKIGAYRYSTDPSTEIICLAYTHHENRGLVRVWIAPEFAERYDITDGIYNNMDEVDADPSAEFIEAYFTTDLTEFNEWVSESETVEAHNAFFERCIYKNIMMPKYGSPAIPDEKLRCSAAKAATYSLPRSLEGAGAAMQLDVQKDMVGSKLLSRMMKPKPARQRKEGEGLYFESRAEVIRLALYCARDIITEELFSSKLPDLIPFEQRIWQCDQDANERGVYCDIEFVNHIVQMVDDTVHNLTVELYEITEGAVLSPGSRKALIAWVESQGYELENTQGPTLDEFLKRKDVDEVTLRGVKIVRLANRTSTKKFLAMQKRVNEDNRMRDLLMYHGANTGRWSGRGVQLHNLPRGIIGDMDAACDMIANNDIEGIQAEIDFEREILDSLPKDLAKELLVYTTARTDAMELFSSAVRGAICSPPGRDLVVADYSSIEARGTPWAAGDEAALEIFRQGKDIYCDMASTIYGRTIEKDKHPKERHLGKQAILGLSYQMGANKFLQTCWGFNIFFDHDEMLPLVTNYEDIKKAILELPQIYFKGDVNKDEHLDDIIIAKFIVDNYRKKYAKTVQFWYDCEEAAKAAIHDYKRDKARKKKYPNKKFPKRKWHKAGPVKYKVLGRFLLCQLPSGRRLAYPYPYLKMKQTPVGDYKLTIHYKGVNSMTKRWTTKTTYGGKLVENIIQAIARDLMANAMILVDDHPTYDMVLTVHDEIVSEADEGKGSVKEFEELISILPDWAEGYPLAAEGWRGKRYRK